jgi:exopolyphosphatase/guanosine-5'-triphosphate,3'-diphosphate pyrophosphatase
MTTRAIIDVGANSTKLLVAKVEGDVVTPVYRARDVTRLSEGFFESRRLRPEPMRRTVDAISRFVTQAQRYSPVSIGIVATSAARDALNRVDLISAIENSTGIRPEIISGEQEAQWAYDGVARDPALARPPDVVFDLGGGSAEFVVADKGLVHARYSYPLGAVRLYQSLYLGDTPSPADLASCRAAATAFVEEKIAPQLAPALNTCSQSQLVWAGCGGTVCALERVLCRGGLESRASILHLSALQGLVQRLWSMSREQRVAEGVAPSRVDSILTGSVIIESIMFCFNVSQVAVSGRGVRYGAILATNEDESSPHQRGLSLGRDQFAAV